MRGGVFGVIELWVENRVMVEVLTDTMQREYLDAFTVPSWTGFLQQAGMAPAAA